MDLDVDVVMSEVSDMISLTVPVTATDRDQGATELTAVRVRQVELG